MAKEKPGVMLYWETFDALELLDQEESKTKTLLQAIKDYAQFGVVPDFAGDVAMAIIWTTIKPRIDADTERYEQIKRQRKHAGQQSAKKRKQQLLEELAALEEEE